MRRVRDRGAIFFILCSLLLALPSLSNPYHQSSQPFNPETTVDAWVKMWNTYDLNMVEKLFLHDARLTYFSSEKEGVIKGFQAILDHHKGFGFVSGGKIQENKLWLEDVAIDIFDSTVIVTGIWFFHRVQGQPQDIQRGPVTIVYVKRNESYFIAHMHFATYIPDEDSSMIVLQ